jgi:PPOX class probable F420-dependent enzyme
MNSLSTPAFDELSSHRRGHSSTTPRRVMTQIHVHGYRSPAMRLADHEARARLESHDHGILCTVHAERGVDAVPVAYAVDDGDVGVPIDWVKPKASLRLQRERNLEADPRATLLVEHWDRSDWSRLWWVRAELRWQADSAADRAAALAARLAERYPQYQDQPFARVLVLRIVGVTGWAAGDR